MDFVSHRCKASLERKCSIRYQSVLIHPYWRIIDFCGYEPFDDHIDSLFKITHCPFCGEKLKTNLKRTHYDVPLSNRLKVYKVLKHRNNGKIRPISYEDARDTAFTRFDITKDFIIYKVNVDFAAQLEDLYYE